MPTGPHHLGDVAPSRRIAPVHESVEDVDIREYLAMLWGHRYAILVVALVAAAAAFVAAISQPAVYESEVPVVVSRPKATDTANDFTAVGNFVPLIANRNVAAQVIKELSLDRPPYNCSPSSFFGSVVTVEEVRNSTVLLVRGRLGDPGLLARMLNRVAQLGVESARVMNLAQAEQARDDIKVQLTESRKRMEDAEVRLKEVREKSQLELLRKDIDAQLLQRSGLLKLQMDLEKARGELTKAEQELAARQKIAVVNRTIDSDPALLESARATGAAPRELLGLKLRAEQLDPVYQDLDGEVARHRATVAGLERQRSEIAARRLDGVQLASLRRLYDAEAEISRLEMEQDLARRVYQDVATSYEKARLTVASRSSALQILDPAVVPDRPSSRHAVRGALFAFVAAWLVASLVFILRHAIAPPPRA